MVIKSNSKSSKFNLILNPNSKINIIFICLGNACRSQMAEAFASHYGGKRVTAWSAGSVPLGRIAEGTEAVMSEIGISLASQYSKGFGDVPIEKMALIITMGCGIQCPVAPGFRGQLIEWDIPDPFGCSLEYFREVRDLVKCKVCDLLEVARALPSDCEGYSARQVSEK